VAYIEGIPKEVVMSSVASRVSFIAAVAAGCLVILSVLSPHL